MSAIDTLIVIVIIVFFILLVWSRIQQQKMSDTIAEIRDIVKGFKQ